MTDVYVYSSALFADVIEWLCFVVTAVMDDGIPLLLSLYAHMLGTYWTTGKVSM